MSRAHATATPRRRCTKLGLLAASTAALAAATPALAAVNDPLLLGQRNEADATTAVHGRSSWATMHVENPAFGGSYARLAGPSGVIGVSRVSALPEDREHGGVFGFGWGQLFGVRGESQSGTGVEGEGAVGVHAIGTAALLAEATSGTAKEGIAVIARGHEGRGALLADGRSDFHGAVTVNGPTRFFGRISAPQRSGVVTFAAGASSVVQTLPVGTLGSTSLVLATLQTDVPGVYVRSAVPNVAGNSFTVRLSGNAPAAGAQVAWLVVN